MKEKDQGLPGAGLRETEGVFGMRELVCILTMVFPLCLKTRNCKKKRKKKGKKGGREGVIMLSSEKGH